MRLLHEFRRTRALLLLRTSQALWQGPAPSGVCVKAQPRFVETHARNEGISVLANRDMRELTYIKVPKIAGMKQGEPNFSSEP